MTLSLRPDLCWIGLFSLDFRHLTDWMLFAGTNGDHGSGTQNRRRLR
jgi:hypothetical protein